MYEKLFATGMIGSVQVFQVLPVRRRMKSFVIMRNVPKGDAG